MVSTILVAQPVSTLRAKLWKVVVKYEIVMFVNFWVSQNVNLWGDDTLSRLVLIQSTQFLSGSA